MGYGLARHTILIGLGGGHLNRKIYCMGGLCAQFHNGHKKGGFVLLMMHALSNPPMKN